MIVHHAILYYSILNDSTSCCNSLCYTITCYNDMLLFTLYVYIELHICLNILYYVCICMGPLIIPMSSQRPSSREVPASGCAAAFRLCEAHALPRARCFYKFRGPRDHNGVEYRTYSIWYLIWYTYVYIYIYTIPGSMLVWRSRSILGSLLAGC